MSDLWCHVSISPYRRLTPLICYVYSYANGAILQRSHGINEKNECGFTSNSQPQFNVFRSNQRDRLKSFRPQTNCLGMEFAQCKGTFVET